LKLENENLKMLVEVEILAMIPDLVINHPTQHSLLLPTSKNRNCGRLSLNQGTTIVVSSFKGWNGCEDLQ
jgi:hypothetical protein